MAIDNLNRITPYYIAEYHNALAKTNKSYAELTPAEIAAATAALQEDVHPNNTNTGLNFANLDEEYYNPAGQRWSDSAFTFSTRWRGEDYIGTCMAVRRDSDDAVANIPFDPVTRNIDVTALLAHVGTGNGYVQTWYNQGSVSASAVQTTPANQPQIVFNGEVHWYNGRVAVKFGSPTHMVIDTATNLGLEAETSDKTFFATFVASSASNDDALISNYDSTPGTKQLSLWSQKWEVESGAYSASASTSYPLLGILRHAYAVYYATSGDILLETSTKDEVVSKTVTGAPALGDFESTIAFYLGAPGDLATADLFLDGYLVEAAAFNQAIDYNFLVD